MSSPPQDEPIWLTPIQVKMLHAEALKLFGGASGVRDEGLLHGALARPRHLWTCERAATLFDLAAAYGFGIAKNHAFVDGNKRTALLIVRAALFRNGYRFEAGEVETVTVMEGVAGGKVSEALLSEWAKANSRQR